MARFTPSARFSDTDHEVKASSFFECPEHRESVQRGVLEGVLPLKYAYAGSAAHTHDILAQGAGYQSVAGETAPLRDAMAAAGLAGSDRIAEIGPGNGHASIALLRLLGDQPRKFLALDFSETLLTIAGDNFRRAAPWADFTPRVWDVEAGPTGEIRKWRADSGAVPLLLLGNTIGNFERPAQAVENILDSIEPGDVLFLGVTLQNPVHADMVAPYASQVFHDAALEPLRALGVEADLQVEYDEEEAAVVGTAILRRPVTVADSDLPAGHRVRCFLSRRFTAGDVHGIVEAAGGVSRATTAGQHAVVTVTKE